MTDKNNLIIKPNKKWEDLFYPIINNLSEEITSFCGDIKSKIGNANACIIGMKHKFSYVKGNIDTLKHNNIEKKLLD